EKEITQSEVFVINRSFDAPIENVFEMWTHAKYISQWLGPKGTKMEYLESQIALGQSTFYKLIDSENAVKYGKITYLKIEQPCYLEYTQIFCDEHGHLSKHPYVPTWPDTLLTRVFFAKESDKQTRVTLLWQPHGKVTAEEIKSFQDMKPNM